MVQMHVPRKCPDFVVCSPPPKAGSSDAVDALFCCKIDDAWRVQKSICCSIRIQSRGYGGFQVFLNIPLSMQLAKFNSSLVINRSSWTGLLNAKTDPTTRPSNNHVDDFSEWKLQQQIQLSPMALANDFNVMCDGPDSLSRKQLEFESSYDFISPRALQQSKVTEDHDPNQFLKSVLDEGFFSEISGNTLLEPQPAAPTLTVEEHELLEALNKHNLMSHSHTILKVLGVKTLAQLRELDRVEVDRLLVRNGMPKCQRKKLMRLFSRSTTPQLSGAKDICAQPLRKKDAILDVLKKETLCESDVLCKVGNSQYSRQLLRELVRSGLIQRVGKGGSKDRFKYHAQEVSQ
jgi:hypothetical protein